MSAFYSDQCLSRVCNLFFKICFSIDTHRLSVDETSIENTHNTADDEQVNDQTEAAVDMGTVETVGTAQTDEIESNRSVTEHMNAEENDDNQNTTKSTEEPTEKMINPVDRNESGKSLGLFDNGTEEVGTQNSKSFRKKAFQFGRS